MPTKFTNKSLYQWLSEKVLAHHSDECLLWPFSVTKKGYGRLYTPFGKNMSSHRVAFFIVHGNTLTKISSQRGYEFQPF